MCFQSTAVIVLYLKFSGISFILLFNSVAFNSFVFDFCIDFAVWFDDVYVRVAAVTCV